ncbi:MAG: TolC family protein [Alphaproteobacteria bacterium]|nr:TolC family protein [Alphaproteobacteria bacterium]MBU2096830.1 TolC family protein [Alphaproteobacteria bacterium]MBU2153457.1 TolC family protein [Alphaproteobacteria bacterium]MBU2306038.1 TolC family protein [Alphaproteobacteria bacterium]MBU2361980.1 TolC family protein [Alphaproteobacteria bacterium]
MSFRPRRRARSRPGLAALASLILSLTTASAASGQASPPSLDLAEALSRASAADPAADGWDARLAAAQANLRQADVKPNPSLGVELENFAGSGAYSMLNRTEATLSYQQTLERGGKREARTGLARAQMEAARRRREIRRLDLLKDVQVAYAEALSAEAELLIADARLLAAQSAQADIDRRVRSAKDPLFAGSRAETATAQAEIERDQARATAENARATLARYWSGGPGFGLNLETFFGVSAPSTVGRVAVADLALLESERDIAMATVRVEQAKGVTDPTVRAGVRYLGQGDEVAFVVGGSLPLRRYDTNKAGVERALAERNAAEADIAAERVLRERDIARLTARMKSLAIEAERIRAEVIPSAIRTVEQVRDGFNRGAFQYLNVTEAERALADTRTRRVAALRQFHLDQATLDRLTGRHAALASSNLNPERR